MRHVIFFILFLTAAATSAQFEQGMRGRVQLNGIPVEGAHVTNLESQKTIITNKQGEFYLELGVGDRLHITYIGAIEQFYNIAQVDIDTPLLVIPLTEQLNELEEVVVTQDRRVTVQSVGIVQGATSIPTRNERKYDAESRITLDDFTAPNGGLTIPLVPFLNRINGRTKQLKKHLAVDSQQEVYDNLYAYHNEFLAHRFGLKDVEIKQFLDGLLDLPEASVMAYEANLDKTRIWLIDHYIEIYKRKNEGRNKNK